MVYHHLHAVCRCPLSSSSPSSSWLLHHFVSFALPPISRRCPQTPPPSPSLRAVTKHTKKMHYAKAHNFYFLRYLFVSFLCCCCSCCCCRKGLPCWFLGHDSCRMPCKPFLRVQTTEYVCCLCAFFSILVFCSYFLLYSEYLHINATIVVCISFHLSILCALGCVRVCVRCCCRCCLVLFVNVLCRTISVMLWSSIMVVKCRTKSMNTHRSNQMQNKQRKAHGGR